MPYIMLNVMCTRYEANNAIENMTSPINWAWPSLYYCHSAN